MRRDSHNTNQSKHKAIYTHGQTDQGRLNTRLSIKLHKAAKRMVELPTHKLRVDAMTLPTTDVAQIRRCELNGNDV